MDISVLITVRNDLMNVQRLMESLSSQEEEFEMVAVDAFSDDGTFEYLKSLSSTLKLILSQKKGNRSIGRNECIRLSTGKKLVFIDSDSEVPKGWISSLKQSMGNDITAGSIIQKSGKRWADLGRVPLFFKGNDVTYPTNNLMISRYVIDKVGLFDERFNTAEDVDFNIRAVEAGFKISYAKGIFIYHFPRDSYSSLMKQSYHNGVGRRLIKRKHGLKSNFNRENLKKHPIIEISRLTFGMLGYAFGV